MERTQQQPQQQPTNNDGRHLKPSSERNRSSSIAAATSPSSSSSRVERVKQQLKRSISKGELKGTMLTAATTTSPRQTKHRIRRCLSEKELKGMAKASAASSSPDKIKRSGSKRERRRKGSASTLTRDERSSSSCSALNAALRESGSVGSSPELRKWRSDGAAESWLHNDNGHNNGHPQGWKKVTSSSSLSVSAPSTSSLSSGHRGGGDVNNNNKVLMKELCQSPRMQRKNSASPLSASSSPSSSSASFASVEQKSKKEESKKSSSSSSSQKKEARRKEKEEKERLKREKKEKEQQQKEKAKAATKEKEKEKEEKEKTEEQAQEGAAGARTSTSLLHEMDRLFAESIILERASALPPSKQSSPKEKEQEAESNKKPRKQSAGLRESLISSVDRRLQSSRTIRELLEERRNRKKLVGESTWLLEEMNELTTDLDDEDADENDEHEQAKRVNEKLHYLGVEQWNLKDLNRIRNSVNLRLSQLGLPLPGREGKPFPPSPRRDRILPVWAHEDDTDSSYPSSSSNPTTPTSRGTFIPLLIPSSPTSFSSPFSPSFPSPRGETTDRESSVGSSDAATAGTTPRQHAHHLLSDAEPQEAVEEDEKEKDQRQEVDARQKDESEEALLSKQRRRKMGIANTLAEQEEEAEEEVEAEEEQEGGEGLDLVEERQKLWERRFVDLIIHHKDEKANLSKLKLEHIPRSILRSTVNKFLRRLDLSHNLLTELDANLSRLRFLQELNVSHNALTSLPEHLFQLTRLRVLDASHNQINYIHQNIRKLHRLQDLILAHNKLSSLPEELCQCSSLMGLSLHHNLLESSSIPISDDYGMGKLSASLLALDLSFNRLKEIPPQLMELTALQELSLSYNKLTYVREELALSNLANLIVLDLSHNQLKRFGARASKHLCALKELVVLSLAHNDLIMLPSSLYQLKNLRSLNIQGNQRLIGSSSSSSSDSTASAETNNGYNPILSSSESPRFQEKELKIPSSVVQGGTKAILSYLKHQKRKEEVKKHLLSNNANQQDIQTLLQLSGEKDVSNTKAENEDEDAALWNYLNNEVLDSHRRRSFGDLKRILRSKYSPSVYHAIYGGAPPEHSSTSSSAASASSARPHPPFWLGGENSKAKDVSPRKQLLEQEGEDVVAPLLAQQRATTVSGATGQHFLGREFPQVVKTRSRSHSSPEAPPFLNSSQEDSSIYGASMILPCADWSVEAGGTSSILRLNPAKLQQPPTPVPGLPMSARNRKSLTSFTSRRNITKALAQEGKKMREEKEKEKEKEKEEKEKEKEKQKEKGPASNSSNNHVNEESHQQLQHSEEKRKESETEGGDGENGDGKNAAHGGTDQADDKMEEMFKALVRLERDANYTPYYKLHFYKRAHVNVLGWDPDLGPVIISITKEKDASANSYWFLLRTQNGTTLAPIARHVPRSRIARYPTTNTLLHSLKKTIYPHLQDAQLYSVKGAAIQKQLRALENKQMVRAHKFGVLYCKEGQIREEEMFSNVETSQDFEEFLGFLGDKIQLQGWKNYSGGLDVEKNRTGTHSIFTRWRDLEIMFHVSTMIPFNAKDKQQIDRKRHLGNDVVVLVFVDGSTPFSPISLTSHFNSVFIVIQVDRSHQQQPQKGQQSDMNETYYKIGVTSKEQVPFFGPAVDRDPPVFKKSQFFREFLLGKLVNAERAAYTIPPLATGINRARNCLISEIVEKTLEDRQLKKVFGGDNRVTATAQSLTPRSNRTKETNVSITTTSSTSTTTTSSATATPNNSTNVDGPVIPLLNLGTPESHHQTAAAVCSGPSSCSNSPGTSPGVSPRRPLDRVFRRQQQP